MGLKTKIEISEAKKRDLKIIEEYAQRLKLDIDEMKPEEFLVAKKENKLVGFGRLKKYSGFEEICTVGVVGEERKNRFGKAIVRALMKKAAGEIYLLTMLPEFFSQFGFATVTDFPEALKAKEKIYRLHTSDAEKVVVMRFCK